MIDIVQEFIKKTGNEDTSEFARIGYTDTNLNKVIFLIFPDSCHYITLLGVDERHMNDKNKIYSLPLSPPPSPHAIITENAIKF